MPMGAPRMAAPQTMGRQRKRATQRMGPKRLGGILRTGGLMPTAHAEHVKQWRQGQLIDTDQPQGAPAQHLARRRWGQLIQAIHHRLKNQHRRCMARRIIFNGRQLDQLRPTVTGRGRPPRL